MMFLLVRYELLLPARYNDRRPVEVEKHLACFKEAMQQFGGATLEPQQLQGSWIFEGIEYEDSLVRLVVEVPDTPENHTWFEDWRVVLKERFGQLDIRITWYPVHVL